MIPNTCNLKLSAVTTLSFSYNITDSLFPNIAALQTVCFRLILGAVVQFTLQCSDLLAKLINICLTQINTCGYIQ